MKKYNIEKYIHVEGASENNLNDIYVQIPRNQLIVITGISGSGKSTLAFDTIYAEGQRRYVESLSTYARQFLGIMKKPNCENIRGLSPAISIQQKSINKNPRSTVGTITEIYDYLRLLYARVGTQKCYKCNGEINNQSAEQMVDSILAMNNKKIIISSPIIKNKKGEFKELFKSILHQGFTKIRLDNSILNLTSNIDIDKNKKHDIDVVIDRLIVDKNLTSRINDSIELALKIGNGIIKVSSNNNDLLFSEHAYCTSCNLSFDNLEPNTFSFNSPLGACKKCNGLGTETTIDIKKIIPDISKSLIDGCIEPLGPQPSGKWYTKILKNIAAEYKFSFSTPWMKLPKNVRDILLYGDNLKNSSSKWRDNKENPIHEGIITNLERRYIQTNSSYIRDWIEKFMSISSCKLCNGMRLKKSSLSVYINEYNIHDLVTLNLKDMQIFFNAINLSKSEHQIADQIINEIISRLQFLNNVGLSYLSLSRSSSTLSGGESQRIRLASQIGTQLMGVLYILDEPSIGLHQRDNQKLINTLKDLRDLGNTVIVVEHDEEIMHSSDWIVDLGPYAGVHGGNITYSGPSKKIGLEKKSITGQYLSKKSIISYNKKRRLGNGFAIRLLGACGNNLKSIDCVIPLNKFVCITGVSGSGKSTLINSTLYPILMKAVYNSNTNPLQYESIEGEQHIDKVISITQNPIGKTPRSNPATYTGVFTFIRDLYSQTLESRSKGYKPGRFSFNVKGGRCESCQGGGVKRIEMHFLPDTYVECEHCNGRRFNKETLNIFYKGKNIFEILEMTVEEAHAFFINHKHINNKLQTLLDVGLGYIKLGQSATTLSGGESQRIKLSTELSKNNRGNTLYILDEPTTGLHFHDIKMLLNVLEALVNNGHSIIVIEHNLDIIKSSDWIIDLGPEGGDNGGTIIAEGTPESIMKNKKSYTGKYLKRIIK